MSGRLKYLYLSKTLTKVKYLTTKILSWKYASGEDGRKASFIVSFKSHVNSSLHTNISPIVISHCDILKTFKFAKQILYLML